MTVFDLQINVFFLDNVQKYTNKMQDFQIKCTRYTFNCKFDISEC